MKRSGWVRDISTLDDHPLENGHVLRGALIQDTLITAICKNKTRIGVRIFGLMFFFIRSSVFGLQTLSRFKQQQKSVKLLTTEKKVETCFELVIKN